MSSPSLHVSKRFTVDGQEYSLAEMLQANHEDEELCEWLYSANVGETFPAFVECTRIQ